VFYRVEACRIGGYLLVTRYSEQWPADPPFGMRPISYLSFGQILPTARRSFIQVGMGTLAQERHSSTRCASWT
jgi:hypothetical protein